MDELSLSSPEHWDSREGEIRARLPSRLNVGVRDITDLLSRNIRPGDSVLEIGCAPGKYLLWCAVACQAKVSGIEYAPESHQKTVELFRAMNIPADLRCEDVFETSFKNEFDVVYSIGLIEHFRGERLSEIVRRHVDLLAPGGKAIIIVPDFSGWYGALARWDDPAVYATHNIDMMNESVLAALAPHSRVYRYGMLTPWLVHFGAPRGWRKLVMYLANLIGLLQPFRIKALCPWLVLEISAP